MGETGNTAFFVFLHSTDKMTNDKIVTIAKISFVFIFYFLGGFCYFSDFVQIF